MGAEFITETLECTPKQLPKAYAALVKQAQWDHGHSGYSGSFAEKEDYEVIAPPPEVKYWDKDKAEDHAAENNPKWGPSYVYRLGKNSWLVAGLASS